MKLSRRQALKTIPSLALAGGIWTMASFTARADGDPGWLPIANNRPIWFLLFNIQTGSDDLRRQSQASALVGVGDQAVYTSFPNPNQNLNVPGQGWDNGEWHRAIFDLGVGTLPSDIQYIGFDFVTGFPDGIFSGPDSWNMQVLDVYYAPDNDGPLPDPDSLDLSSLQQLYHREGDPLYRFNGDDQWSTSNPSNPPTYRS